MSKFHSIFVSFRNSPPSQKKEIKKIIELIVQRHNMLQPYKNMMLFLVQCLESVALVCFLLVLHLSGACICLCVWVLVCWLFGGVSDCRGPRRLLGDISVPSLVENTKHTHERLHKLADSCRYYGSSDARLRGRSKWLMLLTLLTLLTPCAAQRSLGLFSTSVRSISFSISNSFAAFKF